MNRIAKVLRQDPEDAFVNPNPPFVSKNFQNRLFYAWFIACGVVQTALFAVSAMIHHRLTGRFETLHSWSRIWSRVMLGSTGYRLDVKSDLEIEPDSPMIFISNHQNSLDILAHSAGLPVPFAFLAKADLEDVPILGSYLAKACVFVDRSTPRKAVVSIRKAAEKVKRGQSVLIYPEGQRMWGPQMGSFMRGAFEIAIASGAPIVPVALKDAYKFMDERTHSSRPGKITMVIGKPVSLAGKTRKDIPDIQAMIHKHIQELVLET